MRDETGRDEADRVGEMRETRKETEEKEGSYIHMSTPPPTQLPRAHRCSFCRFSFLLPVFVFHA